MAFQLLLPKKVQKEIEKVDKDFRIRIFAALVAIERDPFSGKKLNGKLVGLWSYHVWPYRIIYEPDKAKSTILVIKIGDRKDIYK